MKIIITESQLNHLLNEGIADDVSWFHSHGWVRSDVVKK